MSRAAAGLSGQGSECLGLDDEVSRDHDFGPGFCIWLSDEDFERYGEELQAAYRELPREFLGFTRLDSGKGAQRTGVMRTSDFYRYYIGCPGAPETAMQIAYVKPWAVPPHRRCRGPAPWRPQSPGQR